MSSYQISVPKKINFLFVKTYVMKIKYSFNSSIIVNCKLVCFNLVVMILYVLRAEDQGLVENYGPGVGLVVSQTDTVRSAHWSQSNKLFYLCSLMSCPFLNFPNLLVQSICSKFFTRSTKSSEKSFGIL